MILDKLGQFASQIALNTGGAGSYIVGDVIDLQVIRDVGAGARVFLVVEVDTTATSGGSATGVFNLVTDDNSAMSSPAVIISSASFAVAAMTAGKVLMAVVLPTEGVAYERYLAIQQVTGVAAFTAGKINAFFVLDYAKWRAYADANN